MLDCCYAGGIGKELTKSVELQIDANICVMSACTGYEKSLVIGPLKNSVFVYFLCDSILNCQFRAGLLPIKEILMYIVYYFFLQSVFSHRLPYSCIYLFVCSDKTHINTLICVYIYAQ